MHHHQRMDVRTHIGHQSKWNLFPARCWASFGILTPKTQVWPSWSLVCID